MLTSYCRVSHLLCCLRDGSKVTMPAIAPRVTLDYIFHGSGLQALTAEVPQMDAPPSDHLPVLAKFRLV